MVVIPMWMMKYVLAIGGLGIFFTEGEPYGLLLGAIGIAWCIHNWSRHQK